MNQVSVKRGYRTCSSCGGEGTKISYDYPDLPHVICDDCGGSGVVLVPLPEREGLWVHVPEPFVFAPKRSRRVRYE